MEGVNGSFDMREDVREDRRAHWSESEIGAEAAFHSCQQRGPTASSRQ